MLAEAGVPDGPLDGAHDLARLAPEEKEFPAEAFAKVLADVARDGALLAYGSPFGYRPLRETLAARLERRGVPADADALLIVNGAQQGLDLISRALVDPGDAVAIESPSYSGALALLRAQGARLLGVPLDAEGPALGPLRQALAERPKFLYTIPDFQNPTGLLATAGRRRELVAAATAADAHRNKRLERRCRSVAATTKASAAPSVSSGRTVAAWWFHAACLGHSTRPAKPESDAADRAVSSVNRA